MIEEFFINFIELVGATYYLHIALIVVCITVNEIISVLCDFVVRIFVTISHTKFSADFREGHSKSICCIQNLALHKFWLLWRNAVFKRGESRRHNREDFCRGECCSKCEKYSGRSKELQGNERIYNRSDATHRQLRSCLDIHQPYPLLPPPPPKVHRGTTGCWKGKWCRIWADVKLTGALPSR